MKKQEWKRIEEESFSWDTWSKIDPVSHQKKVIRVCTLEEEHMLCGFCVAKKLKMQLHHASSVHFSAKKKTINKPSTNGN